MVKGRSAEIQPKRGFAGEFADSGLLSPRICQLPRFVDTRAGIWQS
jgi:hypothetical protein